MKEKMPSSERSNLKIRLPSEESIVKTFGEIYKSLELEPFLENARKTVIYEMTDGMRTSSDLTGADSYFDGGIFALRLINILRVLGLDAAYINVIEEKHKERCNYCDIYNGLKKLFPIYRNYAKKYGIRLKFLGKLDESIEPTGFSGNFAKELKLLEEKTKKNSNFIACFLINYSLEWAMNNMQEVSDLPNIDVTVRHTKLQYPTGMMLPPAKSNFSSLVYAQQGSNNKTWSDAQLIYLVGLAMRSKILNESTQYSKTYKEGEKDLVRTKREEELYLVHRRPFIERLVKEISNKESDFPSVTFFPYPPQTKRVVIAGPYGPEIYEF